MFGKHLFDELTGLFNDAEKTAKNPTATLLAEITPYCDSLGILVPKVPDIAMFVEKAVLSLGKELLNLNSKQSAGDLSKSLIEDTKTKAFAIHQIAGIMEKHGKISSESCEQYRKDTFLNALNTIDAIQAMETPIDYLGRGWDAVKEVVRDTLKEPLKDEARKLVRDELQQRFKATEEQQDDPTKAVEEKKGIQDTLATAASYVKAGFAAKDLKKALTPGGGFDYEQNDAYVATMNQYIATKEKNKRLKVASRALYVEGANKDLEERANKVAKGELGGGFLEKASSLFNDFMIKTQTKLEFSADLEKIQKKLRAKEQVISQQLEQLSKDGASFSIDELEKHKEIINKQIPKEINEDIDKLLVDARSKSSHDEDLYDALNAETRKAKLLESKCNLLVEKIDEASQNLESLKTSVSDYITNRKDAWLDDLLNEIVEFFSSDAIAEEKKKTIKIPAAEKLHKEIQIGTKEYNAVEKKALEEGSLGRKADEFKRYKAQFSSDIGKIKDDPDSEDSSQVKIK